MGCVTLSGMNMDHGTSPVFLLCDEYLAQWAVLDPVAAGMRGLSGSFGAVTDYSPDGQAARAEVISRTLAALATLPDAGLPVTGDADRLAALFLRERLEAQAAWHAAGEPLRELRAPIGRVSSIRDSVDLLPRGGDEAWRDIASRLESIPVMFATWRASLDEGLRWGLPAARRQALGAAVQAEHYATIRTHDTLIASYGDGPLAGNLAAAARTAYEGYAELARYLREEYALCATDVDGVGADRYALGARISLGADLDAREAYEWGWAELARIENELADEAAFIRLTTVFHEGVPGHHLQEGAAHLSQDLSRFAKNTFISGHGEGWALYAERLADELGWFTPPGSRLGMLSHSALRAARVVIDIGVHLDLPLPDGGRWSFEKACDVLRERGRAEKYRVVPEVTRYFGWPGQAPSYKLGERAWLAARAEASRKPGFDLKRWHTAALSLGPLGLDSLAGELARL
jgi:uncharacterized protein (DUF885 family)